MSMIVRLFCLVYYDCLIFHTTDCLYNIGTSVVTPPPQNLKFTSWQPDFLTGFWKLFTLSAAPCPRLKHWWSWPVTSAYDCGRDIVWQSASLFTNSLKALIFACGRRANCFANCLNCIPLPRLVQRFCLCWRSASTFLTWFYLQFASWEGAFLRLLSPCTLFIVLLYEGDSVPSHLFFRPKWKQSGW